MASVPRHGSYQLMLIGGIFVGVLGALVSLLSPGGGHGWYSGLIGLVSLVFAPLSVLAWHIHRTRGAVTLARIVLSCGILADLAVVVMTESEGGWSYMANMGALALIWWLFFLSWQALSWITLAFGQPTRVA